MTEDGQKVTDSIYSDQNFDHQCLIYGQKCKIYIAVIIKLITVSIMPQSL